MQPFVDISPSLCDSVIGRQLPQWLQRALSDVAGAAFALCPVGEGDPLGRPRPFKTPLRYTINTKVDGTGANVVGYVQANSPYAYFVHQGTQGGAQIRPLAPGYPLRFSWRGEVVRTMRVTRGATPAQPFLRDALVSVMGATLRAA